MRAVRLTGVLAQAEQSAEQVTQLLPGDRVTVHERRGEWVRVTIDGQPSSKDPSGYPGWARLADLAHDDLSVLEIARGYLGTPYVWGGLSTRGIDCSGLVHVAFRTLGATVPRDACDQATSCEPVVLGEERPGDLWFFGEDADRITHVGFVVDARTILHAPDSGDRRYVVEETLPPERRATLVTAGRF